MPDDVHRSGGGPFDRGRPFDPGAPGHRPHNAAHGHRNGSNGFHPAGMQAHPVAFDELAEPVDLVAVQADDELINALAAGMSVSAPGIGGYDADDRVAAILAAWKADVDEEPIPELVDTDTAVAAVLAGRPPSRRARHLAPVAAAAAFVVLAIGGVSVSSYNAQPEDALWGVSKVLYSERAESVEAAARVEDRIDAAKAALAAGEPVRAAQELAQAAEDLEAIRPQEGQSELAEAQDFLADKAAETPPGQPVNPASPLTTQPSREVPESVREGRPSSPDSEEPTSEDPRTSDTRTSEPGPEVAGSPGDGTGPGTGAPEQQTVDPRRAQMAPEAPAPTATGSPSQPEGGGNGEGEPDDPRRETGSPSATPEGRPDPTTTPAPPPPATEGGADAPASTGPSAAGEQPSSAGS